MRSKQSSARVRSTSASPPAWRAPARRWWSPRRRHRRSRPRRRRARRVRRRRARSARARGAPRPRARGARPAARRSARAPGPGRPGRWGARRGRRRAAARSRGAMARSVRPGSIVGNNDHPVTVDPSIASPHASGPTLVATRAARGRLDAVAAGSCTASRSTRGRRRAPVRAVPVVGGCGAARRHLGCRAPADRGPARRGLRAPRRGRPGHDRPRPGGSSRVTRCRSARGGWRCPGSTSWPPAPGAPPASAPPMPASWVLRWSPGQPPEHPARDERVGRVRDGSTGAGGSPTASVPRVSSSRGCAVVAGTTTSAPTARSGRLWPDWSVAGPG